MWERRGISPHAYRRDEACQPFSGGLQLAVPEITGEKRPLLPQEAIPLTQRAPEDVRHGIHLHAVVLQG